MSTNSPWMVCLRIGNHGVVGGTKHFSSWDQADKERKNMIASPSIRAQPSGTVGVLVMHYKKFRKLVEKGDACTIARIRANESALPDLAAYSQMSQQLSDIDTDRIESYNKQEVKWHLQNKRAL